MTSQRTLNRLFVLHSWAGIVTGLLMFIVCFSGSVVVFKNEIDLWANPSLAQLPRADKPAPLDAVLAQLHTRYPGATVETIQLPDTINPHYFAFVREVPSTSPPSPRASNAAPAAPMATRHSGSGRSATPAADSASHRPINTHTVQTGRCARAGQCAGTGARCSAMAPTIAAARVACSAR